MRASFYTGDMTSWVQLLERSGLRGVKASDWSWRAFWQGAKRGLPKGLPSSCKVRNDYYDTRLDLGKAWLRYRSAIPPERGTSISGDRLMLK